MSTKDGPPIGAMANTALLPGTHLHWALYFSVADVDATSRKIASMGGETFRRISLPDGRIAAACHDPQGAELGLISASRP